LPVIATTHADIPLEVLHGKTGLLAPERDTDAISRHIERFYRMENNEYQQFSRSARAHVEQFFDVQKNAVVLRELYERVRVCETPPYL
jgi:glycosyltransferase involved in cell wall biosynthesis